MVPKDGGGDFVEAKGIGQFQQRWVGGGRKKGGR